MLCSLIKTSAFSVACKNLCVEATTSIQVPSISSGTMERGLIWGFTPNQATFICNLDTEWKGTSEMTMSSSSIASPLCTKCQWWGTGLKSCLGPLSGLISGLFTFVSSKVSVPGKFSSHSTVRESERVRLWSISPGLCTLALNVVGPGVNFDGFFVWDPLHCTDIFCCPQ